jgi:putative MATE family efflux protein
VTDEPSQTAPVSGTPGHRREIVRLAVPAFLALIAEPLFLLADSAIVGHLGTAPLAGLGVASAVLLTAANLFIFLAYGTTAAVARRLGAGDLRSALSSGIDGLWLAVLLGLLAAVALATFAAPFADLFGASGEATGQAVTYLGISAAGLPGMLVVLAATGVLRGLQDTRTPLVASVIGFTANAVLSFLLVHPVGLGIAGAAWGTVIAQTGMAAGLVVVVVRGARRHEAPMAPHAGGVLRAALGGVPLLVRTLALRAVLLITTWYAAGLGEAELAAHQVAMTVWSALAFALDALAIAGQAITGKSLGAGDVAGTREATSTMLRWGVWFGVVLGVLVVAGHRVIPLGFSSDPRVHTALAAALLVVALGQPVAGVAFVLDGVLIGAGDARWLAVAQTLFLLTYLPMVGVLLVLDLDGTRGLVGLWLAFTAFMTVRSLGLWLRSRSEAWMVVGASR